MNTIRDSSFSRISSIEKMFIKTGEILAVRGWSGDGIYEIDIHLPKINFDKWNSAQSIKCRTSAMHYTDYSPATWNASEKTCTLYIDTSHNGHGSRWAKQQVEGNTFYYLAIEAENHLPVLDKQHVFLGDATAIGHFCAVQQLASADTKMSGYLAFNNDETASELNQNCPWLPVRAVVGYDEIYCETEKWIKQQKNKAQYIFYIVGNGHMIVKLRKLLKQNGYEGSQIKSKGFWH